MAGHTYLDDMRTRIDKIDNEFKSLFLERLKLAEEIARIKQVHDIPLHDAEREREIIARLSAGEAADVAEHIAALYTTVFTASRAYQEAVLREASN